MRPQELKASILQLAIQGKLVEQRPEEGTGEELLLQIQTEKQRFINTGIIKKEKPLPEITEDAIPFYIPESWTWIRLGELVKVIGGVSYKKEDVAKSGIRILRGGNIQSIKVLTDEDDVFLPYEYRDDEKQVKVGDFLIVASTGSKTVIGKAGFVDREMPDTMIGAFLRICRPLYLQFVDYLRYIFDSDFYRKHIRDLSQGTNINNVKESYIAEFVIPLPPLAEQKRIVAKIEELLPLIDRYEQAWSKLEDFNKRFPVDMQKSILQTAIQGKLVEQRPEEGTGDELYRQIQVEKQRLIKAGAIKKEKPLPEIAEDEIPFDIPESWKWVQFGDISNILGTGLVRSSSEQYVTAQYYYFKMNNIGNFDGKCHFDNMNMINATPEEYERYKIEKGDFLFNTRNSRELVGKTAVVPEIDVPIILNNNILKIRLWGKIIPEYINCFFNSPLGREQLVKFITNTTNVAAIYQKQLITLYVPLPPLAEQKRIVAKLEEILPLCERLK